MDVKKCIVCKIKIDKDNYKKDRNICKICYNMNRKKYNKTIPQNKITTSYQQPKNENVSNSNNRNRHLIIGFSNCGKTYLMNHILLRKQEPIFIITKSLNQYPNIEGQTSDEIQPLENYENSTVVFDDMLLSKQTSDIDLFFTRGRHHLIDIYYISQSYFHLPKNSIRNNSNIIILFKQTLRDIILIFHDIAGLDMNLEEWKSLCRRSWENDYDYLQIDRFAKIGEGRYTIRNCNKTTYIECICETKPF